jgi:hypothetical protein
MGNMLGNMVGARCGLCLLYLLPTGTPTERRQTLIMIFMPVITRAPQGTVKGICDELEG